MSESSSGEGSSGEGGDAANGGDGGSETSGGSSEGLESMLSHGNGHGESHGAANGNSHSDSHGDGHGNGRNSNGGGDSGTHGESAGGSHGESHGNGHAHDVAQEGDIYEDTPDGSIALIVYENKDNIEFLVEKKPPTYGIKSEANKYSMIGGHMRKVNGVLENPLETLVREIGEEVESKEAQKVIISHINKNPDVYKVKDVEVQGESSKTYIYVVHITDEKEWSKVRSTRFTHDAGPAHVLSLKELLTLGGDKFAFDDYWIYEEYAKNHFAEQYNKIKGHTDSHSHDAANWHSGGHEYGHAKDHANDNANGHANDSSNGHAHLLFPNRISAYDVPDLARRVQSFGEQPYLPDIYWRN